MFDILDIYINWIDNYIMFYLKLFTQFSFKLCKAVNTTGVQEVRDEGSGQTYAYKGTDWYGYEIAKSLKEKVRTIIILMM